MDPDRIFINGAEVPNVVPGSIKLEVAAVRDEHPTGLVECLDCGRARGCERVQCPGCGTTTKGRPIVVVRDRDAVNRLRRWFGLESRPTDRGGLTRSP